MLHGFRGGIHPDDKKAATEQRSIEVLAAPERVFLPLSMHIGAPCQPLVHVGDTVGLGQKIADSESPVSSPVHASVSGKVAAIEAYPHPNGSLSQTVVIENDFQDTLHESVRAHGSAESLSGEEITAIIHEAGIVGLGGATFPTHVKISSGLSKVDTLIINGAECEPYITSDFRIMMESPEEIIGGVRALMKVFSLTHAVIAIESNKLPAITRLRAILPRQDDSIRILTLHTRYPQGAEKQLIRSVTGREVPPGGLPAAVGCAVFSVATTAAIHRAITTGMPLVGRVVTVAGSAVSNPKNLQVRIGTPLAALFEAAGGLREQPKKILMGGPMMGVAQPDITAPVIKATNALLAFGAKEQAVSAHPTCIRCGKCVEVCPMHLMPIYLYMYAQKNRLEECRKLNVADCIECGSCSYTCPGRLYLVQSFRTVKQQLAAAKK